MKRVDLSGFDAEFPPYKTADPNAETFGSRVKGMENDLKYLIAWLIADDSDSIAAVAMGAKRALGALGNEMETQVDEFPWYGWWPNG